MSNLYESAPVPAIDGEAPRGGLSGAMGIPGTVWSALKDTWNRMRIRMSFWTVVAVVATLSSIYYFVFAESLYDSQAIFSIQNKSSMSSGVSGILGATLGTSATSSEAQQVYTYIYSMEMLRALDKQYHLRDTYASADRNPFWRLWWPQVDEDFLWFYQYMVQIDNQSDVGIMTIDVLDFDRKRALAINKSLVALAEKFMNDMNATMQSQTMRFAQTELQNSVNAIQAAKNPQEQAVAEMRLSSAQQALATAEGAANQQSVFIVPISAPSLPTETTHPERLFDILTITFISGLIYAVAFLMWSNVRDHRKA